MWLLLLTTLLVGTTFSVPPLQINDIECYDDGQISTQSYCYLSTKRPFLKMANFGLFVAQPQNSPFIRTQFYNQYESNFVPVGPQFNEDICNISVARSRTLSFIVMLTDLHLYANNLQCPFENNITVSNFPPDIVLFPSFVSTKQYKITFDMGNMDMNKTFFSVSLFLSTTWL